MMKLNGIHFLLSYQCTFECDHCFVWGSPKQNGTFNLADIRKVLLQARDLGGIETVYFEGGEPFLYYATLLQGVKLASSLGFKVGIVSNCYWAVGFEDAYEALAPFSGLLTDITLSSDLFHYDEKNSRQSRFAQEAAQHLDIPCGMITVAQPEDLGVCRVTGQLPEGESGVMYRGRAAEKLAHKVQQHAWDTFTTCPHENLKDPGRVHLDPLGNLHVCQGVSLGNLWKNPLKTLLASLEVDSHPIIGPLLRGGPAELVRHYQLPHEEAYADACHLCYTSRKELRALFPDHLTPDQMYGVMNG